jgi:hypothetical protein
MKTGRNTITMANRKLGGTGGVAPAIGLPEALYFARGAIR